MCAVVRTCGGRRARHVEGRSTVSSVSSEGRGKSSPEGVERSTQRVRDHGVNRVRV